MFLQLGFGGGRDLISDLGPKDAGLGCTGRHVCVTPSECRGTSCRTPSPATRTAVRSTTT